MPTPGAADADDGGHQYRGGVRGDEPLLQGAVLDRHFGDYAQAVARWAHIIGRPAPEPTVPGQAGKPRLNPDFVEWMMGYPEGWTDVGISRTARLRCLGNAVQPQTAAAAIAALTGSSES